MKIILALFTWVNLSLAATVVEAPNLKTIEMQLPPIDAETLVVVDVDYTLLVADDQIMRPCGEAYLDEMRKNWFTTGNRKDGEGIAGIMMKIMSWQLVEKEWLAFLEQVQAKGAKCIVLTAINTGPMGSIPSMEEWRFQQLASLGIDFSTTFPDQNSLFFPEHKTGRGIPHYWKGVFAAAHCPKGQALLALLQKVNWQPKRVIFIDDRADYIAEFEDALAMTTIECHSYHYRAIDEIKEQFNRPLAEFQMDYVVQNGIWLPDDTAQELLQFCVQQ